MVNGNLLSKVINDKVWFTAFDQCHPLCRRANGQGKTTCSTTSNKSRDSVLYDETCSKIYCTVALSEGCHKQFPGAAEHNEAPARYGVGCGFPSETSFAVTIPEAGTGMPACSRALGGNLLDAFTERECGSINTAKRT